MNRSVLAAAVVGAVLAAASPAGSAPVSPQPSGAEAGSRGASQEPFRWTGTVPGGKTLEVKGVQGTIRALPASGGEAEVVAVRRGGRHDPETVKLEVVRHADGVTVCAVYPRGRGGRRDPGGESGAYNRCDPGEWRNLNVYDNDVKVEFTVRVPAGVRLVARNVSGDVSAEGLRGYVDARSVSGNVRFTTTAYGEASTVSGEIFASLGSARWNGDLDFHTVSGNITLELPERASTDVKVQTLSGDIQSDFPLEMERRAARRRAQGTLGEGGRGLSLTTLSGNVSLVRSR